MREATARRAALGTGLVVLGAVALFGALEQPGSAAAPVNAAGETPDSILALGRRVYQEQACSGCHSIAGLGSPRAPLDGVGSRLAPDEIRLWIVDPQAARPGVRKPAYDDLPPDQLTALVAYLVSLVERR